jgi:TolB-like protein
MASAVTSRTSSFSFTGKNEDVRQIGMETGSNYCAEGQCPEGREKSKDHRPTYQIRRWFTHIWSEVYDRDLEDIFEVQDEIR